jgi:hypothetical protein
MLRHAGLRMMDDGVLDVSRIAVTEFSYGSTEFNMTKLNSVLVSRTMLGVVFVDIAREELEPLSNI